LFSFIWISDIVESDGFVKEERGFNEEEIVDLTKISRADQIDKIIKASSGNKLC